jgi:hypothetical protein
MYADLEDAPHGLLGLALIAGFLLMLALDSVQLSMSNNSGTLVSDVKPETSGCAYTHDEPGWDIRVQRELQCSASRGWGVQWD